jgi:hypothetical protein
MQRRVGFAFACANAAYQAAVTGDPMLLDLADRLSQHAIEVRPDSLDAQGARGSVLVRQDRLDEGIALLSAAIQSCRTISDKAEIADELAAAERVRGNLEPATEFSRLAQHLRETGRHRLETR